MCTGLAFRFEHRKWNRGCNGLHQLGQPVAPSILFPVFKSEGEPGTQIRYKAGPRLHDLASWPPLAAGASSRNLGPTS